MKLFLIAMRFLRRKECLLGVLSLLLALLFVWVFLSDTPRNPLHSIAETDTQVFSIGMASDFPEHSVNFFRGPSLELSIISPERSSGYYEVSVVGKSENAYGTLIFILPADANIYEVNFPKYEIQVLKEVYASIVLVSFNIDRPWNIRTLTVPFDWDTSKASKRRRHGEYEIMISGRSFHHLFDASGQYYDPIISGLSPAKPNPLKLGVNLKLKNSNYRFIKGYPEPSSSYPAILSWEMVSYTPSFEIAVVYQDEKVRFFFERLNDVLLLLLGGAIGLILGLLWAQGKKNASL